MFSSYGSANLGWTPTTRPHPQEWGDDAPCRHDKPTGHQPPYDIRRTPHPCIWSPTHYRTVGARNPASSGIRRAGPIISPHRPRRSGTSVQRYGVDARANGNADRIAFPSILEAMSGAQPRKIIPWGAVGTRVAPGPPHRSVRAELPHTAPTSGAWRRSVRWDMDAVSWHWVSSDQPPARIAPK